jgi:hypothetical protein
LLRSEGVKGEAEQPAGPVPEDATMKPNRVFIAFIAAIFICGLAFAGDAWIHVKVDSASGEGETVRVNIPFSLVETVLPMVDADPLKHGKLHIDELENLDIDGLDLRAIMEEFRKTGDTEFVNVQDGSEKVTVSKKGEFLLVNVDDSEGGEKVRVRMPLALVDALLDADGDDDSLNLAAALKVLSEFEGDLVTVQDGDEMVRIWIDNNNFISE